MKKRIYLSALGLLMLAAGATSATAAQQHVSIGTNPVGMALYTMGASIAEVMRKDAPNIAIAVEATNGGVQNMLLLAKKDIEVAFTAPMAALDARRGEGRYKNKVPVLGLCSAAIAYQHSVALASSNVNSITQLRGKRVGMGPPGSLTQFDNGVILSGYDMTFNDFKSFQETLPEMVEKMKNGQLDATFWFGVSPLAPLMDLEQARDVIWLQSDNAAMDKIIAKYPFYFKSALPAGTYAKQAQAVPVLAQRYLIVAHADLSEEAAYAITKSIFTNLEQLKGIYKGWQTCGRENALQSMTVPLHPGAIRYFREVNLPGLDEYIAKSTGQ